MTDKLASLQKEFEQGKQMLADLDERRQQLFQQLLRIDGAIRVLRELTEPPAQPNDA